MAVHAHHAILVANTVAEAIISSADNTIEVINRSGNAEIYFTVGGPGEPPAPPTVEGDDCFVVPVGITSYVVRQSPASAVVKMISAEAGKVSVIGDNP